MKRALGFRLVATVVIAATGALAADASEWQVDLDPERTRLPFQLKATMHTVHGEAHLASGWLRVDPLTAAASGEIVVEAATADTGNASRDKKMHRKVLESDDHPTIVLRPTRVEGPLDRGGAVDVVLVGKFELLGTPHEVSIPISLQLDGAEFSGSASFTIPYVEWGLEDPSTFVLRVAKEVLVTVETEGTLIVGGGTR